MPARPSTFAPHRAVVLAALLLAACSGDGPPQGDLAALGQRVYRAQCAACHQPNGAGIGDAYPSLLETDWVTGDPHRLVRLVLHGVQGPMDVEGRSYDNIMPPYGFLSDEEVAAVVTHVRTRLGANEAAPVAPELVASVRAERRPAGLWQAAALQARVGPTGAATPTSDTTAGAATPTGPDLHAAGIAVYNARCLACHQADGKGIPGLYPPLVETTWVTGDAGRLVRLVLAGLSGPVEVGGVTYNNVMPPQAFLSDADLAAVLSYVRDHFGAGAAAISSDDVAAVRAGLDRATPWSAEALRDATGIPAP